MPLGERVAPCKSGASFLPHHSPFPSLTPGFLVSLILSLLSPLFIPSLTHSFPLYFPPSLIQSLPLYSLSLTHSLIHSLSLIYSLPPPVL